MQRYKLGNLIKKELLDKYKNAEIEKHKFSYKYLKGLFATYPLLYWATEYFDGYGEDFCCWVDEDANTVKTLTGTDEDRQSNLSLYRLLKHKLNTFNIRYHKKNIFVGNDGETLTYYLPLRDEIYEDTILVFDSKHPLELVG